MTILRQGEVVALTPNSLYLRVVQGLPTNWMYHAVVRLPDGRVVDPLLRLVFSSWDEFLRATVVGTDFSVETLVIRSL